MVRSASGRLRLLAVVVLGRDRYVELVRRARILLEFLDAGSRRLQERRFRWVGDDEAPGRVGAFGRQGGNQTAPLVRFRGQYIPAPLVQAVAPSCTRN